MTYVELIGLFERLSETSLQNVVLPGEVNLARKMTIDGLHSICAQYLKLRSDILAKYGTSEDGNNYDISTENQETCSAELEKLNNTIVDFTPTYFNREILKEVSLAPKYFDVLYILAK